MPNPFTDESRDARLRTQLDGMESLRAPETLHRLVMEHKPATVSVGDFALKAMLDSIIDALKVRGDYRGIQRLLVTLFGECVPVRHSDVPNGSAVAERSTRRA